MKVLAIGRKNYLFVGGEREIREGGFALALTTPLRFEYKSTAFLQLDGGSPRREWIGIRQQ